MMSENRTVSERRGEGDFGRRASMPVLSCEGLQLSYGSTLALRSVDLRVSAGESVAVVGPSGSGKSTLLHCLAGLRVPDRGEVRVGDEVLSSLPDRRRSRLRLERMGVVFQFGESLPELTVEDNVGLPLWVTGLSRSVVAERAAEVLEYFGIVHIADSYPSEVSGGEKQRAAVARALVHDPPIVLADEPTGSLDSVNARNVMSALVDSSRRCGRSLVLVTHEMRFAELCDRRLTMLDGEITLPGSRP